MASSVWANPPTQQRKLFGLIRLGSSNTSNLTSSRDSSAASIAPNSSHTEEPPRKLKHSASSSSILGLSSSGMRSSSSNLSLNKDGNSRNNSSSLNLNKDGNARNSSSNVTLSKDGNARNSSSNLNLGEKDASSVNLRSSMQLKRFSTPRQSGRLVPDQVAVESAQKIKKVSSVVSFPEEHPLFDDSPKGDEKKMAPIHETNPDFSEEPIMDPKTKLFAKFSFDVGEALRERGGFGQLFTFITMPHDGFRRYFRVLLSALNKAVAEPNKYWNNWECRAKFLKLWTMCTESLNLYFNLEEQYFFGNMESIVSFPYQKNFSIRQRAIAKQELAEQAQKISTSVLSALNSDEEHELKLSLSEICCTMNKYILNLVFYLETKEDVCPPFLQRVWPDRKDRDSIDAKIGSGMQADLKSGRSLAIIYVTCLDQRSRTSWRKNAFKSGSRRHQDMSKLDQEAFEILYEFAFPFDLKLEDFGWKSLIQDK